MPAFTGWAADSTTLFQIANCSPDNTRMRGSGEFSAFAELSQTTDGPRQKGEANQ
ncbi:MAG TPA: hypothetical protein VFA85_07940 [Terriglobales bacterium]|jgi:hypothetical protein|nr:hypothetical protein [Terriglobales bacterium]